MKCQKCGNEEFTFTEETGTFDLKKPSLKLLIIPEVIFIITTVVLYITSNDLYQLFLILTAITTIIIIVFGILNERRYSKYDNISWRKTSRTKAICKNCWTQYYINNEFEEFVNSFENQKRQ